MAHTGLPSRSEITHAAMGERAECVMLNKGPFVVDSMHMLDDIHAPPGDPTVEEASAAAGAAQLGCPHSSTYRGVKGSQMLVPHLRRRRRSGFGGLQRSS